MMIDGLREDERRDRRLTWVFAGLIIAGTLVNGWAWEIRGSWLGTIGIVLVFQGSVLFGRASQRRDANRSVLRKIESGDVVIEDVAD